jgi:acetaldehyde dehydrogenase/alcohol dehydrogenase
VYEEVKAEFVKRGAYIMTPQQCQQASSTIIKDGRLNADVVGKKPAHLAALLGFAVPAGTKVLIGEVEGIGPAEPMSYEKLCPVLGEWR